MGTTLFLFLITLFPSAEEMIVVTISSSTNEYCNWKACFAISLRLCNTSSLLFLYKSISFCIKSTLFSIRLRLSLFESKLIAVRVHRSWPKCHSYMYFAVNGWNKTGIQPLRMVSKTLLREGISPGGCKQNTEFRARSLLLRLLSCL